MKKVLVVFAVVLFTGLFQACGPEDTASEDTLYEQASGKDEEPDDKDPDA